MTGYACASSAGATDPTMRHRTCSAQLLFFMAAAVLLFAESARAEPPPCAPAIRLEGDPETIVHLAERLESDGFLTSGELGCVRLVVRVAADQDGLTIRIADVRGRSATRTVSDEETAVALIESWATPALMDGQPGLVSSPLPTPDPSPSSPTPVAQATDAAVEEGAIDPLALRRPFAVGMWLGPTLGDDRSLWGDLSLTGCALFGPACVGGIFRASIDFGTHGDSGRTETDRRGLDFLATAELPIEVGKVLIAPGVAMGMGWVRAAVEDGPDVPLGGEVRRNEVTFRLGPSLKASVEVTDHIRVGAWVMFEFAPVDESGLITTENGTTLALTPTWFLRGAIGLQFDSL